MQIIDERQQNEGTITEETQANLIVIPLELQTTKNKHGVLAQQRTVFPT